MAQTVEQAIRQAHLFSDNEIYHLVQLPAAAITLAAGILAEISEAYNALIVDKDEVSLMLQAEAVEDFATRLRECVVNPISYRLITFDVVLEPELVGFLVPILSSLAAAHIPILAFSAYSRDHLFVPDVQFDNAMIILKDLQARL